MTKHEEKFGPELRETILAYARVAEPVDGPAMPLAEVPALRSLLLHARTRQIYVDTADVTELALVAQAGGGALASELGGNTMNQPLIRKVVGRYVKEGDPYLWSEELEAAEKGLSEEEVSFLVYLIVCGRIANDIGRAMGTTRAWDVNIQAPMGIVRDPDGLRGWANLFRQVVPDGIVKIPFDPADAGVLITARDLQAAGVRVNITSTFSARQAALAALVVGAERTNVFVGRVNDCLGADLLGEEACLRAQQAIQGFRKRFGVETRLIVASMRNWRTFLDLAGCDVFTAPGDVLAGFKEHGASATVENRVGSTYQDRLGISREVVENVGADRIHQLHRVDPKLVEAAVELRERSSEITSGEALRERLEGAGFGDLFHSPNASEIEEIRASKIPNLESELGGRVAIDTLLSLAANADFEKHQAAVDEEIHLGIRAGSPQTR